MKLIDLLVKELPKRGGWPEGAARLAQDPDGDIQMLSNRHAYLTSSGWIGDGRVDFYGQYAARKIESLSSDYTTSIVTREQYESALAASEGWIEWGGGECPVKKATLVDVRYRDGRELIALPANDTATSARDASRAFWRNDGTINDIIAYRLHKPGIESRANDDRLEQDLNECIGQDVDQAWNGEVLPPVGTICEALMPGMGNVLWRWRTVKVVESGAPGAEKEALAYDIESTMPAWVNKFRPLRTEAEKARKEAEKLAVEDIINEMKMDVNSLRDVIIAQKIYRAVCEGRIRGVNVGDK